MITHCTPVEERSSSFWSSGTAIETIVWSMNVIATAKIIAARMRFLLGALAATLAIAYPPVGRGTLAADG